MGVLPKKESPTKELCFSCVTPPLEFLASNSHFTLEEAIKSYADVVLDHLAWFDKGHLISKCLFGVLNLFQKTNENQSTWANIVVKLNSFGWFLEETSSDRKIVLNLSDL